MKNRTRKRLSTAVICAMVATVCVGFTVNYLVNRNARHRLASQRYAAPAAGMSFVPAGPGQHS